MAVDPSLSESQAKPNPGATKALGILNIVFGGLQLLLGLSMIALAMGMPPLQKVLNETQAEQAARGQANIQRVIDEFREQEKAETDVDNRVAIRTESRQFERLQQNMFEPQMTVGLGVFNDRKVRVYSIVDGLMTFLLSCLLMVSGIGLLRRRGWGRSLAIWVSALRIPILIGSTAYFIFEVAPVMARLWTEDIRRMISIYTKHAGLDPGPLLAQLSGDLADYTETIGTLYEAMGIGMGVFGLIYPLVVLWVANRAGFRAALQKGELKGDRESAFPKAAPPSTPPPSPISRPLPPVEEMAIVTDRGVKMAPGFAIPTPQPAKTIGLLNIIFGSILALYSSTTLISLLFMMIYAPGMEIQERVVEKVIAAVHETQIEGMAEHLERAETDFERELIQAELAEMVETGPTAPVGFAFMSMGFNTPIISWWSWADSTTSIFFNGLMILAGVGLLRLRTSGRKLGLWVAGSKIVRLLVIWGLWILVVTPAMAEQLGQMMDDMMAQQAGGAGPPPGLFRMTYAIMYSVLGVAMIVFGSIYPAITFWVLRKPGVRAACRSAAPKPEEVFLP